MSLRETNIRRLQESEFDVMIIGGGINGAVSAAALAAHGVKVGLIDSRDFAGFTSQHSSNLIWGGIKYMESYEFSLVWNLCQSRNELMRSFPSTVKEIRFLTTVQKSFRRHPLVLWAGCWLYWLFGRRFTQAPKLLSSKKIGSEEPIVNTSTSWGGVEYSDAYLHDNDARFVFNFIRSATKQGCAAANYVKSMGATFSNTDKRWQIQASDQISGNEFVIRSKVLINAAGAFVDDHNKLTQTQSNTHHLFSKGIHLIVPAITQSERVLAFFADDGRLFFAIPMANRTCIGTTDNRVTSPDTQVTEEDRDFVLTNINSRLNLDPPLTTADIISERCGVRPLAISGQDDSDTDFLQLSRKHVIEVDDQQSHLSIFGGKLTDCLNVGEEICDHVSNLGIAVSPPKNKWYGEPGNDVKRKFEETANQLGLDTMCADDTGESLSTRLWRRYGVDAFSLMELIKNDKTLCEPLIPGTGIRRCEIEYIKESEMIVELEDFLRRRSKLALIMDQEALKDSEDLKKICEILFGEDAESKYRGYFLGN